ncbi:MAG TPA: adenylate/guanylate cyclase domain-containing protein [Actinomycetota bacterium]|jgi:class 3 adenylate cyclase|nr:adenylate/guanylate cyclase domain-containing protein [Actinomycetota bacterium]
MSSVLAEPRLEAWKQQLHALGWSSHIIDANWRLVWVSDEAKQFFDCYDDEILGVGRHVAEAYTRDVWLRAVHPETLINAFFEVMPFVIDNLRTNGPDPRSFLPEQLAAVVDQIEARPIPDTFSMSFRYVDPRQDGDAEYVVRSLYVRLSDEDGRFLGVLVISLPAVRPNLLTLMSQGDQDMYERMARLMQPGPRQAAILFCDLNESGRISRQLPSASYFRLIRRLWKAIDGIVAEQTGIVGKHAGDGASAFFLVEDLGSPSAAAAAAVRAAWQIHTTAGEVFAETPLAGCRMKVGLHWGGNLYMGQLVPGSRLDVTALGDEVNEASRVQDTAEAGQTLVTKNLLEHLTLDDAALVGLDLEKITYDLLADLPGATDKATRDAGTLAVTAF